MKPRLQEMYYVEEKTGNLFQRNTFIILDDEQDQPRSCIVYDNSLLIYIARV